VQIHKEKERERERVVVVVVVVEEREKRFGGIKTARTFWGNIYM